MDGEITTGHAVVEFNMGEVTVVFSDENRKEFCHAKLTYTPLHFPPALIIEAIEHALKYKAENPGT